MPRAVGGHSRYPPVRKSLGQHFLGDRAILRRIVEALELNGEGGSGVVMEIGAGRGALTELLEPVAGRLIAIEYDRALAAALRARWALSPRVTIVEADVLGLTLNEVAGDDYVLVGNIPYYITTPILFHALQPPRPRRIVLLVQREVAERLAAPPGSRVYGALSVNVQAVMRIEQLFRVPAGAFRPPPKVDSAVVRLTPRADPVIPRDQEPLLRKLVQAVFSMRRKQLRRSLRELFGMSMVRADEILTAAGIDPASRPESLSPELFAHLLKAGSGSWNRE